MSERAGIDSPDAFARVARGDGSFSEETARKFVVAYGEEEGVTARQVAAWARLPMPDEEPEPPADGIPREEDIPDLVSNLAPDLQMAQARLAPGQVETIRRILHEQIAMLVKLARSGRLPPTDYRPGEE